MWGTLRAQAQTLALYEGQTRVSAVFDALRRGPAGDEALRVLLGDGAALASSHIENGVCYVELSGVGEENRALTLDALRLSLLSLDGVDEVRLRIDGEPAEPPQN